MNRTSLIAFAAGAALVLTLSSCSKKEGGAPGATDSSKAAAGAPMSQVERGKYLVMVGGCNDCHTPWKMGEKGPEPDMTKMLSGHPEGMNMPPPLPQPMPWMINAAATMTAWGGPWGVSFTRNLTPDPETGLGKVDEAGFIKILRTGIRSDGKPIMPPMPFEAIGKMTDEDLKAIYAYLKSIPPIKNKVPEDMAPMPGAPGSPGAPPMPGMPPPPAPKKK
ncbi:MAG TPA: diheme cytochrome c-553 [Candidatus Kapabacteria bacterium]|nr:diheme cytochrome c-553 [Candidatus Kapabacteria bacterium]